MRKDFKKLTGVILAVIMCTANLPIYTLAATTLESYNFNSDAEGKTPSYIEGDATVSSNWLDAEGGRKAAFTAPPASTDTRFSAKVKSTSLQTFVLRLYDENHFEEVRITPKTTDGGLLYALIDEGNLRIVYANEQIEERKVTTITKITKAEIQNALIDDVKVGEQPISPMPVNLHMYLHNNSVKLGYILFAPDGGTLSAPAINWFTMAEGDWAVTHYGDGLSVDVPQSGYILCEASFGDMQISLQPKNVSDLDVLVFDYTVSTGYNKSEGKQTGIWLKNNRSYNSTPQIADWSEYDELLLRAKSNKATGRVYQTNIHSVVNSTSTYYMTYFTVDWGKKRTKDIVLPIGQESSLNAATSANTWTKITGVDISPVRTTQQKDANILPNTETDTYVEYVSVFLRKKDTLAQFADKEYILNAQRMDNIGHNYAASIIGKRHPRILLTQEKIEKLKSDIVNDDYLKKSFELLKK